MWGELQVGLGGSPDRVEVESVTESSFEIRARKRLLAEDPFLPGHFPDFAIYPGVFIIESVGQAVDELARSCDISVELAEIGSVRFTAPVIPGDTMTITCDCRVDASTVAVRAQCVNGESVKVAQLRLTYRIDGNVHV